MDNAEYQYRVVYVDFRGRISVEGQETRIMRGERSTAFVRRFLDNLGREGWELVGVQPQDPPETAYMVFKKAGAGPIEEVKQEEQPEAQPQGDQADVVQPSLNA